MAIGRTTSGRTRSTSPFRTKGGATFSKSSSAGGSIFGRGTTGTFRPTPQPSAAQSFEEFRDLFPPPAPITPPTITPPAPIKPPTAQAAVVSTPADLQARVDTIFRPQFEALAQRETETLAAVNADLAARGLAESGVGVGQTQRVREEFNRNRTALLGEEAGQLLGVESAVLFQNAANRQQANLANAQFSFEAQRANAANVLAGNTANAQLYLAALGLNAENANNFRQSFLSFFDAQALRTIQQDELRLRFMEASFDAFLKSKALDTDIARINAEAGGTAAQAAAPERPGTFAITTTGLTPGAKRAPGLGLPFSSPQPVGPPFTPRGGGGGTAGGFSVNPFDVQRFQRAGIDIFNKKDRESIFGPKVARRGA